MTQNIESNIVSLGHHQMEFSLHGFDMYGVSMFHCYWSLPCLRIVLNPIPCFPWSLFAKLKVWVTTFSPIRKKGFLAIIGVMGLSFELQSFMQSSWGISFQHF
jgi:hypothetical protein